MLFRFWFWIIEENSVYLQCIEKDLIKERNNGNSSPICNQEGVSLPILDENYVAVDSNMFSEVKWKDDKPRELILK